MCGATDKQISFLYNDVLGNFSSSHPFLILGAIKSDEVGPSFAILKAKEAFNFIGGGRIHQALLMSIYNRTICIHPTAVLDNAQNVNSSGLTTAVTSANPFPLQLAELVPFGQWMPEGVYRGIDFATSTNSLIFVVLQCLRKP